MTDKNKNLASCFWGIDEAGFAELNEKSNYQIIILLVIRWISVKRVAWDWISDLILSFF